ncbi:hypothetical protein [Paenibacillus thermotolerans]|uniref:hypothetical protein n=1 Tax=Paenibacillus thermotolerans TaxID=3027807 RepID=UPI002368D77E|nr:MULTISPECIES: hypothetical protein [unclassified Paenibacillus]
MNIRSFITIGCLAVSIFALSGCTAGNNVQQHYTQDGYMGLSNSNPNLRTHPSHHSYRKDRQLMRQALREMALDKRSYIAINGATAIITINVDDDISPQEAEAIRSDVYSLLKGNNPRYDYEIRFD